MYFDNSGLGAFTSRYMARTIPVERVLSNRNMPVSLWILPAESTVPDSMDDDATGDTLIYFQTRIYGGVM